MPIAYSDDDTYLTKYFYKLIRFYTCALSGRQSYPGNSSHFDPNYQPIYGKLHTLGF